MATRTVTEYRLTVHRVGNAPKMKRFMSIKPVRRRIGILTSDEPWKFYEDSIMADKGPEDYYCCAGTNHDECACGGLTMRQHTDEKRANLPPIESITVHKRTVTRTDWQPVEDVPKP